MLTPYTVENLHINFQFPLNLTTSSLLLTGSLTDIYELINIYFVCYMDYIPYSCTNYKLEKKIFFSNCWKSSTSFPIYIEKIYA